MTPSALSSDRETDEFLIALALISTATGTICLSIAVLLLGTRSGLGTPPFLVILCVAIVGSAAYAPFLLPKACRSRLDAAKFVYALLMLAVMFSPLVLLWLPSWLGYVYVIGALAGVVRAVPYVAGSGWRALATVAVTCVVLGFHLFTAQGVHSAFLPELLALGRFSADPYLHAAIASMIRFDGIASSGVDGTVPYLYHVGSHYWFAAVGAAGGSDSARAYMVGRTVFMLPALYLALFVAALSLRRLRPHDAPFLVVATTVVLILIDGVKLDRYTYRSESEVFGIVVLLLALPLLEDAVRSAEQAEAIRWWRLVPWPFLVLLAGSIKVSVGVLLAVIVGYALARTVRPALAIGAAAAMAVAIALTLRGLRGGGMGELTSIRPPGFLVSGYGLVALSFVFAFALAAALVVTGVRRWSDREPSPSRGPAWRWIRAPLSWEQLVLVFMAAAFMPALVVSGFAGWYFLDALLWFTLAVVIARLSRADVIELWRSVTSLRCGPVVIGLVMATCTAAFLRAFTPGDLGHATREMLAGMDREEHRLPVPAGQVSLRHLFGTSLARHRVLFGPEFVDRLRTSYGPRVVAVIGRVTDREGRSGLGLFVPPENVKFWRYGVDCRSQPLFVPALAGIPMVRGLPPIAEGCRLPRAYGYADYGASSRSVDADRAALCQHARSRGLQRVLVLRDVDVSEANAVIRCD